MKVSMTDDATTRRTRSGIGACVVLGDAMGDYGRPGHLSACGAELPVRLGWAKSARPAVSVERIGKGVNRKAGLRLD